MMGIVRLRREPRICRASSIPPGEGLCKSKNTTSNFPSSRILGASVLLVGINTSMPAEFKTFPIISQTNGSSSTTLGHASACRPPDSGDRPQAGFSVNLEEPLPAAIFHSSRTVCSYPTCPVAYRHVRDARRDRCIAALWSVSR